MELKQKLAQRQCPSKEIDSAIAYCTENDWLNDQRFATVLLHSAVAKGHGWQRVCYDAKKKGIEKTLLETVENAQPHDWCKLAKASAEKRFGDLNGKLPDADCKQRAKWYRYLQYRGFSFDEIRYALSSSKSK